MNWKEELDSTARGMMMLGGIAAFASIVGVLLEYAPVVVVAVMFVALSWWVGVMSKI